jgi:fructoselysine-6-P-deglycase FrlB-like protein
MSNTVTASADKKSAYQRPYKTRNQRREIDRRKHDEAKDQKFLWRVFMGAGVMLAIALAFALKGVIEVSSKPVPTPQAETGKPAPGAPKVK